MQKKNKNLKNKVIITVGIVTIIVLISIIVIQNVIINNGIEENNYLASGNSNSELLAEYIKKGITIGGVTGTLESLDTSDATATAADILSGKTAYADGDKLTGILELLDTSDATATAADILSGKTAYVNGNKITGTLTSSQYKFATGNCSTTYIEGAEEGIWCTVSGLSMTPKFVMVLSRNSNEGIMYGITSDLIYLRNDAAGYLDSYGFYPFNYVTFNSQYGGFSFEVDVNDNEYCPSINNAMYIAFGV